ncbi:integrase core domain-containing protein [Microbispora triticiradicis]|uniref:integrase core domain-containing protein n=1 Tax=Microbispora triticiradicis TaxID=2200763 RepID=UPI001AD60725|nr:transposase [Microbispora triticiradicis]
MTVGIDASIGTVGDALDSALTESQIGLYKTELIKPRGPWRSLAAVEPATAEWVEWFNTTRLHSSIGTIPPDEYEALYYAQHHPSEPAGNQPPRSPPKPGRFKVERWRAVPRWCRMASLHHLSYTIRVIVNMQQRCERCRQGFAKTPEGTSRHDGRQSDDRAGPWGQDGRNAAGKISRPACRRGVRHAARTAGGLSETRLLRMLM